MAREWTLAATLATGIASVLTTRALVFGGEVYFYAGLKTTFNYPAFFKWDGSGLTAISTVGSLPDEYDSFSAHVYDYAIFNGNLFVYVDNNSATSKGRIYRYTSGTSYTLEYELEDESEGFPYLHYPGGTPTNTEGRFFAMDCDSAYLMIVGKRGTGAGQTGARMVARNTSGAYSVIEMPGSTYESPMPQLVGLSKGYSGAIITNNRTGADTFRAVERGAPGPFTNLSGSNVGNRRLIGYGVGKSFWTEADGGNWELKSSDDWGVSLDAAGNLEKDSSNRSDFIFKDCGAGALMVALGSDHNAYTWDTDTGAFVADGAITEGLGILDFFILNGQLYLLSTSETANSIDVWTAGSLTGVKFYQGLGELVYKSDLPLAGVDPGGIAVNIGGVVHLGSNGPAAQMVIKGASPYTDWDDLTGSIPTTGGKVTSLRYIPWELES